MEEDTNLENPVSVNTLVKNLPPKTAQGLYEFTGIQLPPRPPYSVMYTHTFVYKSTYIDTCLFIFTQHQVYLAL